MVKNRAHDTVLRCQQNGGAKDPPRCKTTMKVQVPDVETSH